MSRLALLPVMEGPGADVRLDRFWSNVARGDEDECWEWRALRDAHGYGRAKIMGRTYRAHRLALAFATRSEPTVVLHRCDNPPCCNPAHLVGGTQADNMRDMAAKGRAARGERRWRASLTREVVLEARRLHADGQTIRSIAQQFGVDEGAIGRVTRREYWKHV